ncbi:unnamed protein product, partial [Prunus brigantina]
AASVLPRPFDSAAWTQVQVSFGSDGYTCLVLSGGNIKQLVWCHVHQSGPVPVHIYPIQQFAFSEISQ